MRTSSSCLLATVCTVAGLATSIYSLESLFLLRASAGTCKKFSKNGSRFELCVDGDRGTLTELSSLNSVQFILDKCVPGSNRYVSRHSEVSGISMADYRYAVWAYCNKGWSGI